LVGRQPDPRNQSSEPTGATISASRASTSQ
jgi:hypothetical protein